MISFKFFNKFNLRECFTKASREKLLLKRYCTSLQLTTEEPKKNLQKKLIKVAILGRPNAGKSTLINQIMNVNICDASSKTHTTLFPLRAAYMSGDTQIIFIDTPGLISKKERKRFNLSKRFLESRVPLFEKVDIVGVIYDATHIPQSVKLHSNLINTLKTIPENKPVFLIVNKIDLVKNKTLLLKIVKRLVKNENDVENDENAENVKNWNNFSKVFLISALKGDGVKDIINYLLEEAKQGEWILEQGKICDTPVPLLIKNLVRAKMLNLLPQEIPYKCLFEIEYLEENELGELICVVLVSAKSIHHVKIILKNKKGLKILAKDLEADLYSILKQVVRLRITIVAKKKEEEDEDEEEKELPKKQ